MVKSELRSLIEARKIRIDFAKKSKSKETTTTPDVGDWKLRPYVQVEVTVQKLDLEMYQFQKCLKENINKTVLRSQSTPKLMSTPSTSIRIQEYETLESISTSKLLFEELSKIFAEYKPNCSNCDKFILQMTQHVLEIHRHCPDLRQTSSIHHNRNSGKALRIPHLSSDTIVSQNQIDLTRYTKHSRKTFVKHEPDQHIFQIDDPDSNELQETRDQSAQKNSNSLRILKANYYSQQVEDGDIPSPIFSNVSQGPIKFRILPFQKNTPNVIMADQLPINCSPIDEQESISNVQVLSECKNENSVTPDIKFTNRITNLDTEKEPRTDYIQSTSDIVYSDGDDDDNFGKNDLNFEQEEDDLNINPDVKLNQTSFSHRSSKHKVKRNASKLRPCETEAQERPYGCPICERKFKKDHDLTFHLKCSHVPNLKSIDPVIEYICDMCPREYDSASSLGSHRRRRHKKWMVARLECHCCKMKFNGSINLNIHFEQNHPGEMPYKCKTCEKTYTRFELLKRHERLHTGEKPYVCRICNKEFRTWKQCNKHQVCHMNKDECRFICEQCGKNYRTRLHFNNHLKIHAGNKTFMCETCSACFLRKVQLNNHMAYHKAEKSFLCQQCGKGFKTSTNLATHKKVHEEKKHKCDLCEKLFTLPHQLRTHIKTHHNHIYK